MFCQIHTASVTEQTSFRDYSVLLLFWSTVSTANRMSASMCCVTARFTQISENKNITSARELQSRHTKYLMFDSCASNIHHKLYGFLRREGFVEEQITQKGIWSAMFNFRKLTKTTIAHCRKDDNYKRR